MKNNTITEAKGHVYRIRGELEQLEKILNDMEAKKYQSKNHKQILLFENKHGVKLLFGDEVCLPTFEERRRGEFDIETLRWYCEKALDLAQPFEHNSNKTFKVAVHRFEDGTKIHAVCKLNTMIKVQVNVEVLAFLDHISIEIILANEQIYCIRGKYDAIQTRRSSWITKSSNACRLTKAELTSWRENGFRTVYSQEYGIYLMLAGDRLPTETSRKAGEIDINFLRRIISKAMNIQNSYLGCNIEDSNIFSVIADSLHGKARKSIIVTQEPSKNSEGRQVMIAIQTDDEIARVEIMVCFEENKVSCSATLLIEEGPYSMLCQE